MSKRRDPVRSGTGVDPNTGTFAQDVVDLGCLLRYTISRNGGGLLRQAANGRERSSNAEVGIDDFVPVSRRRFVKACVEVKQEHFPHVYMNEEAISILCKDFQTRGEIQVVVTSFNSVYHKHGHSQCCIHSFACFWRIFYTKLLHLNHAPNLDEMVHGSINLLMTLVQILSQHG